MFKKRIITTFVTIFALGVVFANLFKNYDTTSFRALFIALAVVSIALIYVSCFNRGITMSKNIAAAALAVAAFSFGVLRVSLYNANASQDALYNGDEDTVTVKVADLSDNHIDVTVLISELGLSENSKIRLYPENEVEGILIGDMFDARVKYKATNKMSLYANGINLTASAEIVSIVEGDGVLYAARKSVSDNAEELFGAFYSAPEISKAITTGDRSGLDSYMFNVYKSGGVSHVLSISGLHISLIAMSLHRFLLSISVGKRFSAVASIVVTYLYTALVGFTPGAVRSAVMITFLLVSGMLQRRSDGITALSIALMLLLVINPYSVFSISLQLSFLCCLGILIINPFLDKIDCYITDKTDKPRRLAPLRYRLMYAVASPLIVSFAASVFSFPVLCTKFDTVSYISPLANLIIVPIFSYATGITLIAYLVAPISTGVASIIAFPAGAMYKASTWMNAFLYENDIGVTSAKTPLIYIPLIVSVAMIVFLVFIRKNRAKYFAYTSLMFIVSLGLCCILNDNLYRDMICLEYKVETAEYVYFQSYDKNVYFDIGGFSSNPDVIFENGKTALDEYVIIEYGGYTLRRLDYLTGNLKVGRIFLQKPKNIYEMNIYSEIKELANARNCDIIEYNNIYVNEELEGSKLYMIKDEIISDTFLLALEHNGTSIRFVGDDYESPVNSEYAVLLGKYEQGSHMIDSRHKFVLESVALKDSDKYTGFSLYKEKIKLVGNIHESDFRVYES